LHFLNIELMRIPEQTREIQLSLGKMEFWQEQIEEIYQNKVPSIQEPIIQSLYEACKRHIIPKGLIMNIIKARKFEIENPELPDMSAMISLCERLRVNMIYLNLSLLQINFSKDVELMQCATYVGKCLGLLDALKRIPYNLRKYRVCIPADLQ